MQKVHDIHFEFQTKSQLYKFTDTSLFINYKEYPYKDLRVKQFHKGSAFMNAWYELETSEGKRLIVAYKAKKQKSEPSWLRLWNTYPNSTRKSPSATTRTTRNSSFLLTTRILQVSLRSVLQM